MKNVDKNFNFRMYREDWYLLAIFIMMAGAIIIKFCFKSDNYYVGYVSPDSAYYLKIAQDLLDGKGYGNGKGFFAFQPIGYPTIIFFTSLLTGLSVFWASKLLNIIFIGIILCIFRFLFKHNAYLYGLILLFAAYIEIFSFTWSETAFITVLLWFATSIYLFTMSRKRITFLCLSIMISSLSLFLFRYIGAFSVGLIGLIGLYYAVIKKDRLKSITLIGIAAANMLIMASYLYYNYTQTGFLTGTKRVPAPEASGPLFDVLLGTLIVETLMPIHGVQVQNILTKAAAMFLIQFTIPAFLLWKYRNNLLVSNSIDSQKNVTLSIVFSVIGSVYLISIILTRWFVYFDLYGYRLLAPGSFFLFIAIIFFIHQRGTKEFFYALKVFLLLLAALSFFLNVPYRAWKAPTNRLTYFQSIESLREKYANVEKDSIIVFAPIHIYYLYPDLQFATPYRSPHSHKEKWSDFMKRIDPEGKKNIYLHPSESVLSSAAYDQSVKDFVRKYKEGTLVKLR